MTTAPRPHTVLVVPTRDEADAIPRVAALARACLAAGLVDRVVVADGESRDGTAELAEAAGLDVLDVLPPHLPGPRRGKGDAMWRAAVLLDADVFAFLDADVEGPGVDEVALLLAPLRDPAVHLVKGRFRRLQQSDGSPRPLGGRVTELLAKPLIALLAPEAGHVDEPLSGQVAVRGTTLRSLPIVTGYGVEIAMLLDVLHRHGPEAIVSVDIGELTHREKDDAALVPMAHEVAAALLYAEGVQPGTPSADPLVLAELAAGLAVRPPADDIRSAADR